MSETKSEEFSNELNRDDHKSPGLRVQQNQTRKIKIDLRGVLEDSLITLNNLTDFELEHNEDSITLTFDS